jgi:hypothetical protein
MEQSGNTTTQPITTVSHEVLILARSAYESRQKWTQCVNEQLSRKYQLRTATHDKTEATVGMRAKMDAQEEALGLLQTATYYRTCTEAASSDIWRTFEMAAADASTTTNAVMASYLSPQVRRNMYVRSDTQTGRDVLKTITVPGVCYTNAMLVAITALMHWEQAIQSTWDALKTESSFSDAYNEVTTVTNASRTHYHAASIAVVVAQAAVDVATNDVTRYFQECDSKEKTAHEAVQAYGHCSVAVFLLVCHESF